MADEAKLHKMEALKAESRQLRGTIGEELANDDDHFSGDAAQLLKFHGSYQQDDRDLRNRKDDDGNKLGKAYSCMIRSAIPGGKVTAQQFLGELDLADKFGNGTLRITTRQGFQHHYILKNNLRDVVRGINECGLTSASACGDVNRNVMATPAPYRNNSTHDELQSAADALSVHLKPRSTAYYDLWLKDENGETIHKESFEPVEEPIYGKTYLPRKFKIGLAFPEDNHVDLYTQDVGFLAIVKDAKIVGYNVIVGGGMGTTPTAKKTFPAVGKMMCFVEDENLLAIAEAIVKVQRDFGNRSDRKTARMKYLVANWGIEKFKAKVEEYYGSPLADPVDQDVTGVDDYLGWREQGDGKLFLGINVDNGRIQDADGVNTKSAFRKLLTKFGMESRLTALQSVILCDIDPADKDEIDGILKEHGIQPAEEQTLLHRYSIACPALPLCGLAVTESERVLPEMVQELNVELKKLGLEKEKIALHMTGCPNGCARPYTPDIGLVGKTLGKYTVFLGGNAIGTRLNFIYKNLVPKDEVIPTLVPVLEAFAKDRQNGESFGDFCFRLGEAGLPQTAEA